jgi:hypothetical protein
LRLAKPNDIYLDQQVLALSQFAVLPFGYNDHARSLETQDPFATLIYSNRGIVEKMPGRGITVRVSGIRQ